MGVEGMPSSLLPPPWTANTEPKCLAGLGRRDRDNGEDGGNLHHPGCAAVQPVSVKQQQI